MGLSNLPKAKWSASGKQPILKGDFVDIEGAILQLLELRQAPNPEWVDATAVKVPATADCPAQVLMLGFPNILHPGQFVDGGLSDGKYRQNTADESLDFDVADNRWGTEKASQWYAVFALAGDSDPDFGLKAMPMMRVKSQASQVISLGTNLTPGTGIGYGFTTDELVGAKIYLLSGASRGLVRTISANNNDDGTGGTITYSGDALTLSQGDWFIVLPAANFRFLGDIFNDASSNLVNFERRGGKVVWLADVSFTGNTATGGAVIENVKASPPLANWITVNYGGNPTLSGGYFAHPNGTGVKYYLIQGPEGEYWGLVRFPASFCRSYQYGTNYGTTMTYYALGYEYPEGYF